MFDSLGAIFKGKLGQRKFLITKTGEENAKFLNLGRTKSVQNIRLRFLGTVNHAVLFSKLRGNIFVA